MGLFGKNGSSESEPRLVGLLEKPKAHFVSGGYKVWLYKKCVRIREGLKTPTDIPLEDITDISLMEGSELESRLTLTRLAVAGIFAFALKKKSGGEKFLTIETKEAAHVVEVSRKEVGEASKIVAFVKPLVSGKQVEG